MTIYFWAIPVAIFGAIIIFLIREALIISKRRPRAKELRRHIEMIDDLYGCTHAMEHYREACHICEHYGVPFREARAQVWRNGSKYLFEGDEHDLYELTMKSIERAQLRVNSARILSGSLAERFEERLGKAA
jgi:hypothetical protein